MCTKLRNIITVGNGVLDVPLQKICIKYSSVKIVGRNVEDAVPYGDTEFSFNLTYMLAAPPVVIA